MQTYSAAYMLHYSRNDVVKHSLKTRFNSQNKHILLCAFGVSDSPIHLTAANVYQKGVHPRKNALTNIETHG